VDYSKNDTDNYQENNPLHGVKLVDILEYLVDIYGWDNLGEKINIKCFTNDPSIKSCLKFLRRTPWARDKVEELYKYSVQKN
jgi:uncharacterized protein (DUF2132 family)